MNAVDLVSKVVGVLAAILGTAGYVLVLGAAIMWLRLQQVELPPEVPVSLASRQELIAIGAEAVAVWVLLVAALGGIAAWIVTGEPDRRRFGYVEGGLALALTVTTLLALASSEYWMLTLPGLALAITLVGALRFWPSADSVVAVLMPAAVGIALAVALSLLHERNEMATIIGATGIFGGLILLAPSLQHWRERQEANREGLAQVEALPPRLVGGNDEAKALENALRQGHRRSPVIVWTGRIAVGVIVLLALGVIAVASQLEHDKNFHKVLVSLTNGDCVRGTYVARGGEQLVIADAHYEKGSDPHVRLATIPTEQVLEVQVYGESTEGTNLWRDEECTREGKDSLVRPKSTPDVSGATKG